MALSMASDSRNVVDRAEEMLDCVVGRERNAHGQRTLDPVHRQALEEASQTFLGVNFSHRVPDRQVRVAAVFAGGLHSPAHDVQRITAGLPANTRTGAKQQRIKRARLFFAGHFWEFQKKLKCIKHNNEARLTIMFLLQRLVSEERCSRVGNDSEDCRQVATVKRFNVVLFGINQRENFPEVSVRKKR